MCYINLIMKKLKIGVIGVGFFGRLHALTFKKIKEAEIVGIFDIDTKKAKEFSSQTGIPYFTSLKEILKRIEAVSICTSTSSHYQVAKTCLLNYKHCLVEKPLTQNYYEAKMLERLALNRGLFLQVGHIERFNSCFQAVRERIKNPIFIETHRLNTYPYRSLDISVVLDVMIHDIDIVLGLVNSPLKRIEAIGVKILSSTPDIAQARLIFKNGCIANITSSRISNEVLRKLRVFTPSIYASIDYKNQEGFIYQKSNAKIKRIPLKVEKEQSLYKELREFCLCCLKLKEPSFTLKEALESLRVALLVEKKILNYEKTLLNLR